MLSAWRLRLAHTRVGVQERGEGEEGGLRAAAGRHAGVLTQGGQPPSPTGGVRGDRRRRRRGPFL